MGMKPRMGMSIRLPKEAQISAEIYWDALGRFVGKTKRMDVFGDPEPWAEHTEVQFIVGWFRGVSEMVGCPEETLLIGAGLV